MPKLLDFQAQPKPPKFSEEQSEIILSILIWKAVDVFNPFQHADQKSATWVCSQKLSNLEPVRKIKSEKERDVKFQSLDTPCGGLRLSI